MGSPGKTVTVRGARSSPGEQEALFVVVRADRPDEEPSRHLLSDLAEVVLGRDDERTVRRDPDRRRLRLGVPDPRMSSSHAKLGRALGQWFLSDAGSKNGTFVNGARVDHVALADGDVIEAGHTLWLFRARVIASPGDSPDLRGSLLPGPAAPGLATLSAPLAGSLATVCELAASAVPIVLCGETGTGKEVVARAVHALSARAGDFVAVNCGALPETLVESQRFGHRKGAFSGAIADQPGLVRAADRGTLFLDEIGDLPLAAQAALLRVLQEHEVTALGATRPVAVDFRLLAATHRDRRNHDRRNQLATAATGRYCVLVRPDLGHVRLTAEEALRRSPSERWELVEGEVVMMSPAGGRDARVVAALAAKLVEFADAHQLGQVLAGDPGFILRRNPDTVRGPDIAFLRKERTTHGLPAGFFEGAPDLAIEVRSPSDGWPEILRKAGEYLAAGTSAVWVVDPEKGLASIFTVDGVKLLAPDDALEAPDLLPGLSLKLRLIFA